MIGDEACPVRRTTPLTMMKGTTIRTEMMRMRVQFIDLHMAFHEPNGQLSAAWWLSGDAVKLDSPAPALLNN